MAPTSPGQHPGTSDPAQGPAPAGLIWTRPPKEKRERPARRSEEHTSELQSPCNLVCRLLLEKKKEREILLLVHGALYIVARRFAVSTGAVHGGQADRLCVDYRTDRVIDREMIGAAGFPTLV